jgi:hypothetical protein
MTNVEKLFEHMMRLKLWSLNYQRRQSRNRRR